MQGPIPTAFYETVNPHHFKLIKPLKIEDIEDKILIDFRFTLTWHSR
jgi:hypothetical protein